MRRPCVGVMLLEDQDEGWSLGRLLCHSVGRGRSPTNTGCFICSNI